MSALYMVYFAASKYVCLIPCFIVGFMFVCSLFLVLILMCIFSIFYSHSQKLTFLCFLYAIICFIAYVMQHILI